MRFALCGLMCVVLWLVGCSTKLEDMLPDRRPDYKQATLNRPLDLPPGFSDTGLGDVLVESAPETAKIAANTGSGQVLPSLEGVDVVSSGDARYLRVSGQSPQVVWPRLKAFWIDNGMSLAQDSPQLGVMETDWIDSYPNPSAPYSLQGLLHKFLGFVFTAPRRDRFRTQLEPVDGGTVVRVTHSGMEEVVVNPGNRQKSAEMIWQPSPPDPGLELEMLNRIRLFLGADQLVSGHAVSSPPQDAMRRSSLDGTAQGSRGLVSYLEDRDGQPMLRVLARYDEVWRLAGVALDDMGFDVEQQNRAQGLYRATYRRTSADLFSSDTSRPERGETYQIRLAGQGDETWVVVQDGTGQPEAATTARAILSALRKSW